MREHNYRQGVIAAQIAGQHAQRARHYFSQAGAGLQANKVSDVITLLKALEK